MVQLEEETVTQAYCDEVKKEEETSALITGIILLVIICCITGLCIGCCVYRCKKSRRGKPKEDRTSL